MMKKRAANIGTKRVGAVTKGANPMNSRSSGPKAITRFSGAGNNPTNPSRQAANTKNSMGKAGAGTKQIGIHRAANIVTPASRGLAKVNSSALPLLNNGRNKSPMGPTLKGHNSVAKADVTRMKSAHLTANGMQNGGGFKGFIGGK